MQVYLNNIKKVLSFTQNLFPYFHVFFGVGIDEDIL